MTCLKKCKLKTQVKSPFIQGRGSDTPDLMIISLYPGKDDDYVGEALVGEVGDYLDRAIDCMDESIKVFLTHIVKCRTFNPDDNKNRNPSAAEVRNCIPHLFEEIERLKPKLIMTLGETPFRALSGMVKAQVGKILGHPFDFTLESGTKVRVIPNYHPSATLYAKNDDEKDKRHHDILKVFGIAEDILLGNYKENKEGWKHYVITTPEGIPALINKFSQFPDYKFVAHDLEASTLKPFRDKLILYTASFGFPDKTCYCLVCDHPHYTFKPPPNWHSIWMDTLRTIYSMEDVTFIAHKLKYEMSCIYETLGIVLKDAHDTLLMHYTLDERPPHDLETIGMKFLDEPDWKYESEAYLAEVKSKSFGDLPLDIITRRNNKDTEVTFRAFELFSDMLEEDGTYQAYENTVDKVESLMMIEKNGIKTDLGRIDELLYRFNILKYVFDKKIYECEEIAVVEEYQYQKSLEKGKKVTEREKFNPKSNPQKQYLLYDVLKLPITLRTKTGQPATGIDVLVQHLDKPICRYLTILSKVNYYLDSSLGPLKYEHQGKDGRVHSEFNLGRVQTGRLSSTSPNLQNINKKAKYIFVPEEDSFFIEADFSQFELRILAALSGDETMKQIFKDGRDIHTETSMRFFGTADSSYRRKAKEVIFGINYGMGPKGLSDKINSTIPPEDRGGVDVTVEEAAGYIEEVDKMFPEVPVYKEDRRNFLRIHKYLENLYGKRRRYPAYSSRLELDNPGLADSYFREGFNHLVQGPAGEITLTGIDETYKKKFKDVNTVHDSILFEAKKVPGIPDEETARIQGGKIKGILEDLPLPFKIDMKFKVDIKWGYDMMHLKEVEGL